MSFTRLTKFSDLLQASLLHDIYLGKILSSIHVLTLNVIYQRFGGLRNLSEKI